jgi:hypothetical protein
MIKIYCDVEKGKGLSILKKLEEASAVKTTNGYMPTSLTVASYMTSICFEDRADGFGSRMGWADHDSKYFKQNKYTKVTPEELATIASIACPVTKT